MDANFNIITRTWRHIASLCDLFPHNHYSVDSFSINNMWITNRRIFPSGSHSHCHDYQPV